MNDCIDIEPLKEQAELLKVLAHPVRLCIVLKLLHSTSLDVTSLQCCLGIPQSTLSQHLSMLRLHRVVTGDHEGTRVMYSVSNNTVKEIVKQLDIPDEVRKQIRKEGIPL